MEEGLFCVECSVDKRLGNLKFKKMVITIERLPLNIFSEPLWNFDWLNIIESIGGSPKPVYSVTVITPFVRV